MRTLTCVLYIFICFGLALVFASWSCEFGSAQALVVRASGEDANLDSSAAQFETKQERTDQNIETQDLRIERHLEYTDERLNDVSDKVENVEGIGTGALGVLGILQILGLVVQRKKERDH